jgi:hypothetical protein
MMKQSIESSLPFAIWRDTLEPLTSPLADSIKIALTMQSIYVQEVWRNQNGEPVVIINTKNIDGYVKNRLESIETLGFNWHVLSNGNEFNIFLTYKGLPQLPENTLN